MMSHTDEHSLDVEQLNDATGYIMWLSAPFIAGLSAFAFSMGETASVFTSAVAAFFTFVAAAILAIVLYERLSEARVEVK